jgi:hypothetical protein
MEAWDRFDSATLDSDGNPIPVHGALAWLISGIALGCGCVALGAVLAFVAWYVVGMSAVWQASVGAVLILLGIWQIEGGIRQTATYLRDKKVRIRAAIASNSKT